MRLKKTEFIVDSASNKKSVIIEYNDYVKMIRLIDDMEDSKKILKTENESEIPLLANKRKKGIV
jgi:hypothetical protein